LQLSFFTLPIAPYTDSTSRGKEFRMPHPVVHFEIGCKDKAKTSDFYRSVFGWVIDSGPMGAIDTGSGEGIAGHIASLGHEPHQFIHFYIETDDVVASLRKVEAEGGKLIVPPVQIPTGTFAWFADIEGNVVGLWKPKTSTP
jgi:predicted enzyme related to lactoylglutathione lyase